MGTISYEKFWLLLEGRLRNIFKHGFMSIAAVIIMIACLLLTGIVTLIAYNINLSIIDLQQSNEIVVFIDDSLTTREARALATEFERIDNIATVDFEDRDEALEIYRQQLGEDADILRTLIPATIRCATAISLP